MFDNRFFAILAVVLFAFSLLVLVFVDSADRVVIEGLALGGLTSLAASHAVR